eukprot:g9456.t6
MRAWLGVAFALSLDAVAAVVHLRGNQSLMADERGPRVYFLFLASYHDILTLLSAVWPPQDVWTAFFNSAEKEQYRAFAHCKEQSCQQQLAESPIVPVPTVPSYYCTDLVSPMNQLLSYALSKDLGAGNARDKFAFVSDSALPAKPFSHIHQVLSHREGSDFCVFPPGEWADLPDADAMEVAVKVHQWITLTREHAQRAVEQWQKKVMQNFMGYFKMNQLAWNNMLDNNFADDRNWGCLDEFWFVTALFGTLKRVSRHGDQLGAELAARDLKGITALMPRQENLTLGRDWWSQVDEVWTAFFNSADKEQYRAFAHCKEQSCQQQLAGSPIMPVPTVPSKYCKDLVSPMNQLLSYALSNDLGAGNARDKFAFVSDSTLPAKPFLHIHQVWSQREGSDFCVAPPADWAEVPAGGDAFQMAVKTSQWSTLTREHAQRAVEQWQKNVMRNLMIDFEMNQRGGKNSADKRNTGCLDEFWFVTVLFGPLKRASPDANEPIDLPRFTGSPLQIDHKAGWQGQCDTFVIWAKHTNSLGQNSKLGALWGIWRAARRHIASLGRTKAWRAVLQTFLDFPGADGRLNNAAAAACTRGLAWSSALELLQAIPRAALRGNQVTFNTAAGAPRVAKPQRAANTAALAFRGTASYRELSRTDGVPGFPNVNARFKQEPPRKRLLPDEEGIAGSGVCAHVVSVYEPSRKDNRCGQPSQRHWQSTWSEAEVRQAARDHAMLTWSLG